MTSIWVCSVATTLASVAQGSTATSLVPTQRLGLTSATRSAQTRASRTRSVVREPYATSRHVNVIRTSVRATMTAITTTIAGRERSVPSWFARVMGMTSSALSRRRSSTTGATRSMSRTARRARTTTSARSTASALTADATPPCG